MISQPRTVEEQMVEIRARGPVRRIVTIDAIRSRGGLVPQGMMVKVQVNWVGDDEQFSGIELKLVRRDGVG